jgi:hypothetical protein
LLQGCLGTFPYETLRPLASHGEDMPVELVAFPGCHFVSPTEEGEAKGLIPGCEMETKFRKVSSLGGFLYINFEIAQRWVRG